MAASNEWDEWHLTPNGWVPGSVKTDFKFTEVPAPEGRVATYRYREYIASVYSKVEFTWERIWVDEDAPIQALLDQHGKYPTEYIADRIH